MTVYVDDMRAPFRRLIMCHMLADTDGELCEMARKIDVNQRHHQGDHFDICLSKRALAVQFGAVEITQRQAGCMTLRRRATGSLGEPDDAIQWVRDQTSKNKAK